MHSLLALMYLMCVCVSVCADDTSYCWIAVDEDDRSERTGLMMRWWLMYVPSK
jgi:hypothetical protein